MTFETSKEITMSEGTICVSNHPIVPVVVSDETSLETWLLVQNVVDAAIAKTYEGERVIDWQTCVKEDNIIIGLQVDTRCNLLSLILSSSLMLRELGWVEAAACLQKYLLEMLESKKMPQDVCLVGNDSISLSDFCLMMTERMNDDSDDFDVDSVQYDALADKFKDELEGAMDNTVEFSRKAMEKARQKLTDAGVFTEEKGEKLKGFLENDLSRVAQELKKGAKEKLNPSRLGSGALASMSKLLHKTSDALAHYADKTEESLTCKSGEITSAGKLACKACGYEMNFKKTGRIPPCPKCHKTEFTKGY